MADEIVINAPAHTWDVNKPFPSRPVTNCLPNDGDGFNLDDLFATASQNREMIQGEEVADADWMPTIDFAANAREQRERRSANHAKMEPLVANEVAGDDGWLPVIDFKQVAAENRSRR